MTDTNKLTYIDTYLEHIANEYMMSKEDIEENKQMAIMRDVGVGNRDVGQPVLWFSAMINECVGSLQVIFKPTYHEFIKDYGVREVGDLEGKSIWVLCKGTKIVWLKPCII